MNKLLLLTSLFLSNFSFSQESHSLINSYFKEHYKELGLTEKESSQWIIYNEHTSNNSPIHYIYTRQTFQEIEIYNAIANFAIKENTIILSGNRLVKNIQNRVNTIEPKISADKAILSAIDELNISSNGSPKLLKKINDRNFEYESKSSSEIIPVKLMLLPVEDEIRLVWDLSIYENSQDHWWSVRIDAVNGELIDKLDWVTSCTFEDHQTKGIHECNSSISKANIEVLEGSTMPSPPPATDQYLVLAIPLESPSHGPRSLVVAPSDPIASQFGWHDNNGIMGDEYTITRGNNVHAQEDVNDNDGTGYSPNSGGSNSFIYPIDFSMQPSTYQDAAITNLFYMNNIMHDVFYHYGFDEASGNFQDNNYGNGGIASDHVNADAQDGGGTNNANFATPADGGNPRMQMFLWTSAAQNLLTVNSPVGIAGPYLAIEGTIGVPVPASPLTANLALYDDGIPDENDACENPINGVTLNGKIVVIRRGTCLFVDKIVKAEAAGAVAVIMVNNVVGGPITMGGTDPGIGIPAIMVSDIDGEMLIAQLEAGTTINATLQNTGAVDTDGDMDNAIIAHEYGHGISTRLTGGAANSNCLGNAEQMGEGWSDWFGLMLTIEPGDQSTDNRGIGTYVSGQPTTGFGIRPAPYSTDWAINDYTYAATNNAAAISEPHGIGFVWATMLWDLNWALVDQYGLDYDVYYGSGGNNIAMNLVVTALKLQPCEPGFIDGRDAILDADQLLYGGANQCLIWNVFANRGLGFSATQGSSGSRSDQTEAFNLPPSFSNSASTQTANSCGSYVWPTNGLTYNSSGTYQETLTNMNGCDSTVTLNLTINSGVSSTQNITACADYYWPANGMTYNADGQYVATLSTVGGCDSTVTLNFTMNSFASSEEIITACESYFWDETSTTYTGSGNFQTTLLSSTGCDSIVTLILTVNNPTTSTQTVTACNSYNWQANGQTYTGSGTFIANFLNSNGCDSTATLNLTINSANATIQQNTAVTLEATSPGATAYQWINCSNNNVIGGAINQTYTSPINGTYAVIVTQNGCQDTSDCITISEVGIVENDFGTDFIVYPNPTFGHLYFEMGQNYSKIQVKLFATNGELIKENIILDSSGFELQIDGAPGMYFIEIESDHKKASINIIKE